MPLLQRHHRLREGFTERCARQDLPGQADLWIQAASVGEAYLAGEILNRLPDDCRPGTLLTANTSQGLEILRDAGAAAAGRHPGARVACRYFPFDRPAAMDRFLRRIRPRLVVLLESEIWPGLLSSLKAHGSRCLLVNGRMTPRSLRRYRLWPGLWKQLRPDRVLAVSAADAERFGRLFGAEIVGRMPNIKFDRLAAADAGDPTVETLRTLLPQQGPFIVLGSVRQEEEPQVRKMLGAVLQSAPEAVIGLFPRHLHRTADWERNLGGLPVAWQRRSAATRPVTPGTVILWDRIGELSSAYRLARAAFVGGSLAPKGGQNFLEALAAGVRPVIGPSWENFAWVGPEIVSQDLLRVAADWKQAADFIGQDVRNAPARPEIQRRFADFIRNRQGGSLAAGAAIREMLGKGC